MCILFAQTSSREQVGAEAGGVKDAAISWPKKRTSTNYYATAHVVTKPTISQQRPS
jgi:hypothetical protein